MAINKPATIIILFIIIVMIVFLFVLPKYQEFKDLEKTIIQKQAEYGALASYYEKIADLFGDIESRKDVLVKIDGALLEDVSFASLMYFLQIKGMENELVLKSIMPPKDSSGSYGTIASKKNVREVKPVVFNIGLSGNYQNIKKFLSDIDNSARLMQVNAITFNAQATPILKSGKLQNQLGFYDFNLEIQTYTY